MKGETCRALFFLAGAAAAAVPGAASAHGVVIERPGRTLSGDAGPLVPGMVLVAWSRVGAQGVAAQERPIRSPFDLDELAKEQLPRGGLVLHVLRDGQPLTLSLDPATWPLGLEVRPAFSGEILARYERGRALLDTKKVDEGLLSWREAATALGPGTEDPSSRCWLLGRIGGEWAGAGRHDETVTAYDEALKCAEPLGPAAKAWLLEDQAAHDKESGRLDAAQRALEAACAARSGAAGPLATAACWRSLGHVLLGRGQLARAVEHFQQALSRQEAEIPDGLLIVTTLLDLGNALAVSGEYGRAEPFVERAERISAASVPGTTTHLAALRTLGGVAYGTGDLARAETLWRQGLEGQLKLAPESADVSISQFNLGIVAFGRGDLAGAEGWFRRALTLAEKTQAHGPQAMLRHALGQIALARGELDAARDLLQRSLSEIEAARLGPYVTIGTLNALGLVLHRQLDAAGAKALFERAAALCEQAGVRGPPKAEALGQLGEIARREGDRDRAEGHYRGALAALEGLGRPGVSARILHALGTLERERGRTGEAADLFAQAVDALESQRARTGGSDEARSAFASRFVDVYHDRAETLVAAGRTAEAYAVVEKSRARSFLDMLATRDLVLEGEVAAGLERDRRRLEAEHQRTLGRLTQLDSSQGKDEARALLAKLGELQEQQARLAARIRRESPRAAELRYPQTLEAPEITAGLDAGALLLEYSVGREKTLLFALGTGGLEAVTIAAGEADLRRRVDRWRRLAERAVPRPEFYAESRALYDLLLRPVEARLRGARRLLVSPDGPLHALPFAALRRDRRYLCQSMPVTLVPSGTVLAQWSHSRPGSWPRSDLLAFADPVRPPAGLERLPESRLEVAEVARLFPRHTVRQGERATEEAVANVGKGVRYVHFAGHALVDERTPLESALVLSPGPAPAPGSDDGRLQAWEIYERVRLDADLVALSACRSAAGTARPGEGLMGLTRAFQFAGARSVLASLWSVGDSSARGFMTRFYAELKQGAGKDEALRRTQAAAVRAGHHPIRWAAYQLYGDWR